MQPPACQMGGPAGRSVRAVRADWGGWGSEETPASGFRPHGIYKRAARPRAYAHAPVQTCECRSEIRKTRDSSQKTTRVDI